MGRLHHGGVDRNIQPGGTLMASRVASITEAWIETRNHRLRQRPKSSPPSRRRGSKLCAVRRLSLLQKVASITEAWIETPTKANRCGMLFVASITEAWIETFANHIRRARGRRRLHHGGVDRNWRGWRSGRGPNVASITEAWIETAAVMRVKETYQSRLHHGGVDRNSARLAQSAQDAVASITEAWIETTASACASGPRESPPSRRRGSKRFLGPRYVAGWVSPPSRRRGSKHRASPP